MRAFYDALYRKKVKIWPCEYVVAFFESRLERLKGKRILDIGCGAGRHAIFAASRGMEAHGIDVSEVGIKHAREWAEREQVPAMFNLADFTHIPHPDEHFAAVISWESAYYGDVNEARRGIAEAFRVLQPGGDFLLHLKSKDDFRFQTFRRMNENTCETEQGGLMTCFSRDELEELLSRSADRVNIETLSFSIENGSRLVSNFIATGVRKHDALRS